LPSTARSTVPRGRPLNGNAHGKGFAPGQSGNPSGRPKIEREVIELARAHSAEAIETLVRIMREGKPNEAAAAANALLDRGFGRPRQIVDANLRYDVREMTDADLLSIIVGDDGAAQGSLH